MSGAEAVRPITQPFFAPRFSDAQGPTKSPGLAFAPATKALQKQSERGIYCRNAKTLNSQSPPVKVGFVSQQ